MSVPSVRTLPLALMTQIAITSFDYYCNWPTGIFRGRIFHFSLFRGDIDQEQMVRGRERRRYDKVRNFFFVFALLHDNAKMSVAPKTCVCVFFFLVVLTTQVATAKKFDTRKVCLPVLTYVNFVVSRKPSLPSNLLSLTTTTPY